jgi:hypothetical protein
MKGRSQRPKIAHRPREFQLHYVALGDAKMPELPPNRGLPLFSGPTDARQRTLVENFQQLWRGGVTAVARRVYFDQP